MINKKTILILLMIPLQTLAWGPIGHRTVGLIADSALSPNSRALIQKILGRQSLADVANWADAIKSGTAYEQTHWYHFDKIPDQLSYLQNLRSMPPEQRKMGGLVAAILMSIQNIRDPKVLMPEKADSLKFLVHFLGDLHQPLHTGRPEDNGGNKINVIWFGQSVNLHQVWDSAMIRTGHKDILNSNQSTEAASLAYAQFLVRKFSRTPLLLEENIELWLNESIMIRKGVYDPMVNTDQSRYQNLHLPEIDQRIVLAGARLAYLINQISAGAPRPHADILFQQGLEQIVGPIGQYISLRP